MLRVGDTVPDIELDAYQNNTIKKINLSDCKGKWIVLLFYPADFTFVCPTELEEAANLYEDFKKQDAELISISTDTAYVHKAWHDVSPAIKKIRYPMAADPAAKLCRVFGTYVENEGLSLRASIIIDPDMIIKSVEMHDNSIGRNIKEILRKLQACRFVRENGSLVCPVNWTPGSKTLKPSIELIGKI